MILIFKFFNILIKALNNDVNNFLYKYYLIFLKGKVFYHNNIHHLKIYYIIINLINIPIIDYNLSLRCLKMFIIKLYLNYILF